MSIKKQGFTLAELLLCIAIIGVVSAMGMTITKKSTDRAYNLYFYSGYINLYNAIADAKANGKTSNQDIMSHASSLLDPTEVAALELRETNLPFLTYKAAIFNPDGAIPVNPDNLILNPPNNNNNNNNNNNDTFTWPSTNDNDNNTVITTTNSIKYYYSNNLQDGLNGLNNLAGNVSGVTQAFPIVMTVPQRQTRENNGIATVRLLYIDKNGGYLIPVSGNNVVDLQNRRDLLPAYLDDGLVGRHVGQTYRFPAYMSYKEAYCRIEGNGTINNIIDCNGIESNNKSVLAIANPQKAR